MSARRLSTRSALFLGAALLLPTAQGSGADRLGAYDFSYESSGDTRVRPVQVFDDGRSTYFQFRAGEPMPAIFAQGDAGTALQMPQLEGPYVRVPSLSGTYTLRLGYGVGRVSYIGGRRAPQQPSTMIAAGQAPIPAAQTLGAATSSINQPARLLAASQLVSGLPREMFQSPARNAVEENSYATPLKGDTVEWTRASEERQEFMVSFPKDSAKLSAAGLKLLKSVVDRAKPSTRFEVIGRDDDGHKERIAEGRAQAVVNALLGLGASRTAVTQKTTAESQRADSGLWFGASVRVHEAPVATNMRGDPSTSATRLKAGGQAEAMQLLEQAGRQAAPVPATPAAPAMTTWTVRKSDETIDRMLARWGRDSGWRVVWEGAPSIPIVGDSQLDRAGFFQAAAYVISQAKASGYRIKATAYRDQVLQIVGE